VSAADRLDELAAQWGLGAASTSALGVLLERVATDPAAPTTVTAPREAVDVHIADSLSALRFEPLRCAGLVVDLGSGAGFPGLALAAALPAASVVLIESQRRKAEFLASAAQAAGLSNVRIENTRAELWRDGRESADVVTARALAAQPVVLEYAAPLLRLGGSLIDWRGVVDPKEAARSHAAGAELGLELREELNAAPWPAARDHTLARFDKVAATPQRFPRREGVARKRPLGGVPAAR
jgi:16S rRNA (guanine527-N7)-methyltransferase